MSQYAMAAKVSLNNFKIIRSSPSRKECEVATEGGEYGTMSAVWEDWNGAC